MILSFAFALCYISAEWVTAVATGFAVLFAAVAAVAAQRQRSAMAAQLNIARDQETARALDRQRAVATLVSWSCSAGAPNSAEPREFIDDGETSAHLSRNEEIQFEGSVWVVLFNASTSVIYDVTILRNDASSGQRTEDPAVPGIDREGIEDFDWIAWRQIGAVAPGVYAFRVPLLQGGDSPTYYARRKASIETNSHIHWVEFRDPAGAIWRRGPFGELKLMPAREPLRRTLYSP